MRKFCITLCAFAGLIVGANGQINNAGFENSDSTSGTVLPADWGGDMGWGSGISTHANTGSQSLYTWTWYTYVSGFIFNTPQSANIMDWTKGGTPISNKPTSMTGYYHYEAGDAGMTDSAIAKVLLKKWNTTTNQMDTIGYGEHGLQVNQSFSLFEVPILDMAPGISPDSICIYFESKAGNAYCNFDVCHHLYIDDLSLNTATGLTAYNWPNEPAAWPNPAQNELTLQLHSKAEQAEVVDASGRVVWSLTTNPGTPLTLHVADWPNGLYILRQNLEEGRIATEKLLIAH